MIEVLLFWGRGNGDEDDDVCMILGGEGDFMVTGSCLEVTCRACFPVIEWSNV